MTTYEMSLSFQRPPLNMNDRMHWAKKAKITKSIRQEVYIRAKAARLRPCKHLTVRFFYRPRDKRRRDPANCISSQKPIVDGLVQAGLVPDDTAEYVTETIPTLVEPIKGQPGKGWVELTCQY